MAQLYENLNEEHLPNLLRESIADFMEIIDIRERNGSSREDKIQYETWVRYCLVTMLIPDVLAIACGTFDKEEFLDVINSKIPALLRNALVTIPSDAAFIGEVMSRLPESDQMKRVADLGLGSDHATDALESFNAGLYQVLDYDEQ